MPTPTRKRWPRHENTPDFAIPQAQFPLIWTAVILGYRMNIGDLCWTRNSAGVYFLGRIMGPWEYLHGADADNHDVHSVRPCDWQKVGPLDEVPGAVERSFGPSRTIQAVQDASAIAYSEFIFAKLRGEPVRPCFKSIDLFELLSPLDHEDIASLYLQIVHGFVIIPSTVKSSTLAYEWVMYDRKTGRRAAVQVKSGRAKLKVNDLAKLDFPVYIMATDEIERPSLPKNAVWIDRDKLLEFVLTHRSILPGRIKRYLEWANL